MTGEPFSHLTLLGSAVVQPSSPAVANLERIANPSAGKNFVIRLTCPEFTTLCPLTGQPDFAILLIDYIPRDWIVESKSFKILMFSYRNHGTFHEGCTMEIAGRLVRFLDPIWLRIGAYWYPRGGIPIDVFWQTGTPPTDAWIPSQDVSGYRGRG
jgi:7-cyano-7-deazaguanine reductase